MRCDEERTRRLARYPSRSRSLTAADPSHYSMTSRRRARASRRIEGLLGPGDVCGDVPVLDGASHHQIDSGAENLAKIIEESEAGIDPLIATQRFELDKKVNVAFTGTEVIPEYGPEHVESRHVMARARRDDQIQLAIEYDRYRTPPKKNPTCHSREVPPQRPRCRMCGMT